MKLDVRRQVFTLNSEYLNGGSTNNLQIDHIYQKSKEGSDLLGNLQVLCAKCNLKKGSRFQSDFFQLKEKKS